jgi:hypothetical protein
VASLDLFYGAGGRAHALDPAGTFTFSAEDSNATSPKFDVIDSQGVLWKVKLGDEAQAETAATRFLWAAGYLTDELYYVADLTVTGLPALERGREFVTAGGVVHGARLERKHPGVEKLGDWDWFDNPFVGQRELNGLRVMMSLLNSWDLKTINNAIYAVDGERHYLVSDLGATFGKSGDALTRTKGVPDDYANSKFIAKVTPECIDFVLHSRPHFLGIVDVWNYRERLKMEQITRGIPRADVQWLARRLSQLSRAQIRDAVWPGVFISESTLNQTVNAIRRALDDDARRPRFVRTSHGFGYAFSGEARDTTAQPPRDVSGGQPRLVWGDRVLTLTAGENLMGRDPGAAVCLDAASVSRHHARILVEGPRVTLEDLGSKNGTSLNGERVWGTRELRDGDAVRLGEVQLLFRSLPFAGSTETERGRVGSR